MSLYPPHLNIRIATILVAVFGTSLTLVSHAQTRESLTSLRADIEQNKIDIATAQSAADAAQMAADAAQSTADAAQMAADAAQATADGNTTDITTNATAITALETRVDLLEKIIFSLTKTAFVTSATYSADLLGNAQANFADCAGVTTGLEGADCICQETADAAGLDGTFLAWISTSLATEDPESRFTQSSVPYILPNLAIVADNWADLTDATLDTALNITESGSTAGGTTRVWTNVKTDGTRFNSSNHCADWTSASTGSVGALGVRDQADNRWTAPGSGIGCDKGNHLYCFEQ